MHNLQWALGSAESVMQSMDKQTLIAILTGLAMFLSFAMGYLINGFTA
jgi:hypothetical protein